MASFFQIMVIILVRANSACTKKELRLNDPELENNLRKQLHVLTEPSFCGVYDIQEARKTKEAINLLLSQYTEYPQLLGIKQMIEACFDNEDIVIVDGEEYSNLDIFAWQKALHEKGRGKNPMDVYHNLKYDLPSQFFPRHDLYLFADMGYDQFFGEEDKRKRHCRFCGKDGANIFGDKKSAHAISYFLGNSALFCLEECKNCNNKFGSGIEQDLMNYYGYYRVAEGRKSRTNKSLVAEGMNYLQDAAGLMVFGDNTIAENIHIGQAFPKEGVMIHLNNKEPVILHNVYRTLVKYMIACMPSQYLEDFCNTIEWINGGKKPRKKMLPPVYRYEKFDNVEKPSLCIYIRKDNKMDLPYCVGEIRFMECLYVFAVPYCTKDVMNPYLERPLKKFVSQRYPDIDFTIENFCDDEEKMVTNHIKLEGGTNTIIKPMRDNHT